jgi:predicted DNA-binding transcriptional regulator YafY
MKQKPLWKRRKWSLNRLVALLSASKKETTFAALKERFGLTLRDLMEVERGLLTAANSGSPLLGLQWEGAKGGLTAKSMVGKEIQQLAGLDLSETLWAVRALEGAYGGPRYDKALKSIARAMTQGEWKEYYERLDQFYPEQNPPLLPPESRAVIETLQEHRFLSFQYKGAKTEQRTLKPISVRRDHNRWYVYGWDVDRKDWRNFLLRDMENAKAGDKWASWLPERDLREIKAMDLSHYRPSGNEVQVKVKIRQPAYGRFKYLFPLSNPPAKGWATLTLPSNSPEWVARRFLPGLGNVQILGPEKFRLAWLAEIKAVQQIYK